MASNIVIVKIDDHTDDIKKIVSEKINLALDLMGEVVEGYAKEDCPVDTGLLRNSLTHAVSGKAISHSYHASYGANRRADGKRYGAGSGKAGSVNVGRISGTIGSESDQACYVGTNVKYGPAVEFRDISHRVGKAHFLRDAGQGHIPELREVCQKALKA